MSPFDYATYVGMSEEERNARYPHTKVVIPGERLWARRIDAGHVMLDNDPLDERFRYADIVSVVGDRVNAVVQRTFAHKYGFRWDPADLEAEDMKLREAIANTWGNDLRINGSFFCSGLGFVLTTDAITASELVVMLTVSGSPVTEIANLDGCVPDVLWGAGDAC